MNIVTVKINGVEYNLKGDEREEYLHKVAGYVDKKLKSIMSNNNKLSTSSAAVLTAVNAVDDLFKSDRAYSDLLSKVEKVEESERALMDQVDSLKKQLQHLENYNKELASKVKPRANEEEMKFKDEKINGLTEEIGIIQESAQKYMQENKKMKSDIKELKFQLQSAKYKIIDLQNRLLESQISLVKEKKFNSPLLKVEK
jgi:cell division protein ZapA